MASFKPLWLAGTVTILALSIIPAQSQTFPGKGDDTTSSLGSFKLGIVTEMQHLFANCPAFDTSTGEGILKSSTLFDPGTLIGRSDVLNDGSDADHQGVPVGSAGTVIGDMTMSMMFFPPPNWPCLGDTPCSSGPGTREVHTEVRSLKMTASTPGGGTIAVRAGTAYPDTSTETIRVSPGEVESHSGPAGGPDFPASSFFDVFVKVDLPACGSFPALTVANTTAPIIVKNNHLIQFPPKVAYLHDQSTIVPVTVFSSGQYSGAMLGYFLLAGHGVGFSNSNDDTTAFNNIMNGQTAGLCPNHRCDPPPPPPTQPSPTPTPTPPPLGPH